MAILAIIVVLGVLSRSVPVLIARATQVVAAMLGNKATFPSPTPALAKVTADIAALSAAEAALKSRSGTLATREDARKLVIEDLHQLHAYVQQLASANPAQAAVIAQDALMKLRGAAVTHKSDLATKQMVSGSLRVVAKAAPGGHSYEWQYSTDGKVWTSVQPTVQAHVVITGLQPGVLHYFRQRAVTRTGPNDWSAPISALVS